LNSAICFDPVLKGCEQQIHTGRQAFSRVSPATIATVIFFPYSVQLPPEFVVPLPLQILA
jgi:hypothetical protein